MLNIYKGLNEVVSPASPFFEDGMATVASNARIGLEGVWEYCAYALPTAMTITVKGDNGQTYTTANIITGVDARTAPTVARTTTVGARQEAGIYYYIATNFDTTTSGCEGIATGAKEHYVYKGFNGSDTRVGDVPQITAAANCNIYRTKVIYTFKGGVVQRVQKNDPTEFFYVGNTGSGTTLDDYLHDSELGHQYTATGSELGATPNLIANYDGRIFAFFNSSGLYARYSNTGKPVEFPQVHTLTYTTSYSTSTAGWDEETISTFKEALTGGSGSFTVNMNPILDNGATGETYLFMPELSGKSIVGAYEFKGKLWVWTANTFGYITSSGAGYRYVHLSDNFGLITNTLAIGDTFLYGCDTNGAWVLDGNFPKRLSYGIVNPTITVAAWNDTYKEYHFGTTNNVYIYNARLDTITSNIGAISCVLFFWFKFDDREIKENIKVTILANGETYTTQIYAGDYPDTATTTISNTFSDLTDKVKVIPTNHSGRYIGVYITSTDTSFKLHGLNIEYIPAKERGLR